MGGIVLSRAERAVQRIVDAVIQLNQGRSDACGTVTFRANQTTTFVSAVNCSKDSKIALTPITPAAAIEYGAGTWYIAEADVVQGGFTITHANAAGTTRSYFWIALG